MKIFTYWYYVFFIYLTIKQIIILFPFNIEFVAFSLDYFFKSKLFLIYFLQFFLVKCSNNFFLAKIINNICPWNSILKSFNCKNFFRSISSVIFIKNILFSLILLLETIYVFDFTSTGFILIVLWYALLYLLTIRG